MFTILDAFIVLIVVLQSIRWAKQGLLQSIFPLAGFWLGLLGGAWLVPYVIDLAQNPLERLLITFAVLIGLALIGGAIGGYIGSLLSRVSQRLKLHTIDSVLGAIVSAGLALFIIWILAALVMAAPFQGANQHIRESAILQKLNQELPPAPQTISRIGNLIDPGGFPRVFTGLEPRPIEPVDLPDSPAVQSAVAAAGDSTLRIESRGCGGIVNGSGFIIGENLVMTNAHVIAGIDNPTVVDAAGVHRATPVYFDPDRDIALLRARNLAGEPLPTVNGIVDRGTQAVALGYPGGGRLSAEPSGVLRNMEATGRDIYGQSVVTRSVYELQASISSGNSGGPVVTPEGRVIGMVFARSLSSRDVGYALVSPTLRSVVEQASTASQVDTARCAQQDSVSS